MATTIDKAKAKLAAKLTVMPAKYAASMGHFFGRDVSGSAPVAAYRAKIGPGVENEWERGLKAAFGI